VSSSVAVSPKGKSMYKVLSILLGGITALMIFLNGKLASHIGNYVSSSFVHATGLILIALLVLLMRSKMPFQKPSLSLLISGGVFGFLTVVCANVGVMRLGVSLTLALGLLAQTMTALIIDHIGWLGTTITPFDRRKIGSMAAIVAGIIIMAYT
jgi:bacterial/archaeal transporter family-2 protein